MEGISISMKHKTFFECCGILETLRWRPQVQFPYRPFCAPSDVFNQRLDDYHYTKHLNQHSAWNSPGVEEEFLRNHIDSDSKQVQNSFIVFGGVVDFS